jgi:hypothetical protein
VPSNELNLLLHGFTTFRIKEDRVTSSFHDEKFSIFDTFSGAFGRSCVVNCLVSISMSDVTGNGDLLEGDSGCLVSDVVHQALLVAGVRTDSLKLSGHVVHEVFSVRVGHNSVNVLF